MAFSSLYIGATGMISHGQRMNTIGNNIANVNTIAFKGQKTHFENLFCDDEVTGGSQTGNSQTGHGVGIADVITDFRIGSFEPGSDVMDMAIAGKGFFAVSDGADTFYTRAGNFRFDKEGYLVNPHGLKLQGKAATVTGETVTYGATKDIQLALSDEGSFTIPSQKTTSMTVAGNLGSDADLTTDPTDPHFALSQLWDANATGGPLGENAYSHSQTMKVYDSDGQSHEISIYYDRVIESGQGGNKVFEYVVGMDPAEDGTGTGSNAGAGMLMIGTLTFSSTGQLLSQTAYTQDATASGVSKDLSDWTTASFDDDGYPQFTATFQNIASGASTTATATIGLNMGLTNTSGTWATGEGTTAADVSGSSNAALPTFESTFSAFTPTAHSGSSSTAYQSQDGYAEGYLTNLEVDMHGVMTGIYSNGQNQELYKLQLYIFTNDYGLRREGDNLFSATNVSGKAIEGDPLQDARGSVASKFIEGSNVDIATEFVEMIMTQRGFQANSKIITTSDEMLKKAVELKR